MGFQLFSQQNRARGSKPYYDPAVRSWYSWLFTAKTQEVLDETPNLRCTPLRFTDGFKPNTLPK